MLKAALKIDDIEEIPAGTHRAGAGETAAVLASPAETAADYDNLFRHKQILSD